MGKKKSKTMKQKQAKVVSASTSKGNKIKKKNKMQNTFGGIPMSKGGLKNASSSSGSIVNKARVLGGHLTGTGNQSCDQVSTKVLTTAKVRKQRHDEHSDFDREYASLQERQYHQQLKNKKTRSKNSQTQQNKNNKNGSKQKHFNFSPPSLQLHKPLTAEQMMDDAAKLVAEGMNEIGQSVTLPSSSSTSMIGTDTQMRRDPPQSNLLQILAAKKRNEWQIQENKNVASSLSTNAENAFHILHEESDDEIEKKKKIAASPYQFAPASFTLQPPQQSSNDVNSAKQSGGGVFGIVGDDYDPDL